MTAKDREILKQAQVVIAKLLIDEKPKARKQRATVSDWKKQFDIKLNKQ